MKSKRSLFLRLISPRYREAGFPRLASTSVIPPLLSSITSLLPSGHFCRVSKRTSRTDQAKYPPYHTTYSRNRSSNRTRRPHISSHGAKPVLQRWDRDRNMHEALHIIIAADESIQIDRARQRREIARTGFVHAGAGIVFGTGVTSLLFFPNGRLPFLALVPFRAGRGDGLDRLDEVALIFRIVAPGRGDGHYFRNGLSAGDAPCWRHISDGDVDGSADAGCFAFRAHDG